MKIEDFETGNIVVKSFQVAFILVLLGFPIGLVAGILALTGIGMPIAVLLIGIWAFMVAFSPIIAPCFAYYMRGEAKRKRDEIRSRVEQEEQVKAEFKKAA